MSARRRLLFSLASIIVLSISTHAQEAGPNRSLMPIELKLRAISDKVCLESLLPLELKMTNHTSSDVEIRGLDVFRNYTIESTADDGSRKPVGSLGIWPSTIPEEERLRNEVHVIKPAETYTTVYRLPLWYSRPFSRRGKFRLRTYYKQIATSNFVTFEILNCKTN